MLESTFALCSNANFRGIPGAAAMSKFRIKMKLQGFELEVEGSREDASLISRSLGEQMSTLLQPAGSIIDGEVTGNLLTSANTTISAEGGPKKTRRRKQSPTSGTTEVAAAIDFKHSPEKFGNPKQEWKTAEKALWLLYVVQEITGTADLSAKVIAETFNKHFRQSGPIQTGNTGRDLGKLKTKDKPSPVGEDTTKSPSTWFLTDAGRARAQGLVAAALGQPG